MYYVYYFTFLIQHALQIPEYKKDAIKICKLSNFPNELIQYSQVPT